MASGDVEIVIGAKDQATEILRKTEASMQNFEKELKKVSASTENMQASFDRTVAGFKKIAVAATAAIAVFKGAIAAFGQMNASVEAFSKQEEAARGMTQAQLDFAASLQVATNAGDEMTLMLMKKAEAMGASKDESDDMAASAIALAQVFGINQEEALKKLSQAVNGNANAFAELIPEIRNATTEQEKLDLIQQRIGTGFTMLQEKADTTQGAMQRSAGAFGDLQEKIGALFAPLYRIVHTGLAVFAETLQTKLIPIIESFTPTAETMGTVLQTVAGYFADAAHVIGVALQAVGAILITAGQAIIGFFGGATASAMTFDAVFKGFAKGIIYGITFIEVAFTNLGTIWQITVDTLALSLLGMVEDFKHAFTVVIPALLKWFAENAGNIFRDIGAFIITVFSNLFTKISNVISVVFNAIKNGLKGGLSGLGTEISDALSGSLIEGFEATTAELPQIPGRQITAAENMLAMRAGAAALGMANEFATKYEERIAGLDTEVQTDVKVDVPDIAAMAQPGIEAATAKIESALGKGDKAIGKQSSAIQELQAFGGRLLTKGPATEEKVVSQLQQLSEILAAAPKATADELSKKMKPKAELAVKVVS